MSRMRSLRVEYDGGDSEDDFDDEDGCCWSFDSSSSSGFFELLRLLVLLALSATSDEFCSVRSGDFIVFSDSTGFSVTGCCCGDVSSFCFFGGDSSVH